MPKIEFKTFQKLYFEFPNQGSFLKTSENILFDAEFHSLQNGLFGFECRSEKYLELFYKGSNLLLSP